MDAVSSAHRESVRPTRSVITPAERWDHLLARWGYRRDQHRIVPGLYALGSPTPDSPVFVTANYTLSFDALREALAGTAGYILVLDTQGINVWCAAGKGTFGTDELARQIETTKLDAVVRHRTLILPQLGAPGVSAHEVKTRTGFRVEYGPVRASDLPEYLQSHRATSQMREVRFDLRDRLTLVPMELVAVALPLVGLALVAALLPGTLLAPAAIAAVLAGVVAFPLLLPWLPTHDFSTKGLALGLVVALPFALASYLGQPGEPGLQRVAASLAYLLGLPPITAYLALNFTGSTTFTSRSGVKTEIYSYIPVLAGLFVLGIALSAGAWASGLLTRGGA